MDTSFLETAAIVVLVVAAITAAITVAGIAVLVRDRRTTKPVVVTVASPAGADLRRAA